MKIILSRKGFDSANGGIVSPIMEDGTLISFPIPSDDKDNYEDLIYAGQSYIKILQDLNYKEHPKYHNCHLDPDLNMDRRRNKIDGWHPVFGQVNSSAVYLLEKVNVEVGDLFLFFGNYHKVRCVNGKYQYVKKTGDFYSDNDLQLIWGYMQVGKIIKEPEEQKKYSWHPHSSDKYRAKENYSNVMFVASETLSFNGNMPGAGVLTFREDRVLTAKNFNKATWVKRSVYDVDCVIGNRKNSSKTADGIYYSGIWQELGLKESLECEEWAKSIVQ
ncbi:MAG: hypothetical protein ACI4VK_04075 [Candidatus Coproplasma sp.]